MNSLIPKIWVSTKSQAFAKRASILIILFAFHAGYAQLGDQSSLTEEASMKAEMALIDGEKHLILENYAKALEMFYVARDINPNAAAIHFKIAEVLFKNKAYKDAVESAERAIELDGDNKFYYLLAVDIHTEQSDLQSAQKTYEELLKLPDAEDYFIELGLVYEYQGKNNKAIEMFTKAQDHFGTNEAMVIEKQKIYSRIGDQEAIVAEWERLVSEYPSEDEFVFKFAEVLIRHGKTEKAKENLKALVANDVESNRANLMLAEILKNEGHLSEAMQFARKPLLSDNLTFDFKGGILNDFMRSAKGENQDEMKSLAQEVASVHPTEYKAQAFAGDVLYQLGDRFNARSYYIRAIRISPDNYPVWQNILSIESELSMLDSLTQHAEEALEYFPNQAAIYYLGGTGYLLKKEYQQSVQLLEMGKRYVNDRKLASVFNSQLGDAYNALGNNSKSDQSYEAALEADASNEHVLNNYSYFLTLRKEDIDKALKMSSRLIQLKPNVSTYLDTHGWVLFSRGDYSEAKKYLQKAANLGKDGTIFEHYGDVLYKLGDKEGALEQWEKAAALNDASDLIHKKIADKKFYE